MEGSNELKKAPSYPSFGPPCDHCNRPDTSNMTWTDGVKNFFSNLNATPRMGPLGYILGSAYSPLVLERDMPNRNWRDAFEDLLALDTGGNMIPDAHRKAEDAYAAKNRYNHTSETISMLNTFLREQEKLDSRLQKLCKVATENDDKKNAEFFGGHLRSVCKADTDKIIATAEQAKSAYEALKDKSASSQKSHGQWIASLISSGALPGWYWNEQISVDGPIMGFGRSEAPPELEAGITMTEKELSEQFVDGQPQKFGSPQGLPPHRLQALRDGVLDAPRSRIGPHKPYDPGPSSTLMQVGTTETFKRSDGSKGTKVTIENHLVDGKSVKKEYILEPAKVLEEMYHARKSMLYLGVFLVNGPQDDQLDLIDSINQILDEKFTDYEGGSL
ncbi:MAG: hypothetical protein Q9180_005465 [Flavoplaca navasiana]